MDILKQPGNLGSTRGTLLTIHHGDWPAYPLGENFYTPLMQLTAFPPEAEFVLVDDMDQSFLLVADVEGTKLKDLYDEKHIHVAVRHDDLLEMHGRGIIDGVEPITERRWHEEHYKRFREGIPEVATLYYKDNDGEMIPMPEPDFKDYDTDFLGHVMCSTRRLRVTPGGRQLLLSVLREQWTDLRDGVGDRVTHLFELRYYDTAIREACVQLEVEIKRYLATNKFGNKLVEQFVNKIRDEKKILESYLRTYRQELRTVFRFIRNDFMHNLRAADEPAAYAMLFRIARARSMLNELR